MSVVQQLARRRSERTARSQGTSKTRERLVWEARELTSRKVMSTLMAGHSRERCRIERILPQMLVKIRDILGDLATGSGEEAGSRSLEQSGGAALRLRPHIAGPRINKLVMDASMTKIKSRLATCLTHWPYRWHRFVSASRI